VHELGGKVSKQAANGEHVALLVVCMPGRCGGAPTIGHSRLPLRQFVAQVRAGWTDDQLREGWPDVSAETWQAVRALSQHLMPAVDDASGKLRRLLKRVDEALAQLEESHG
jgi:uncharacterized protein (DUF433 family)